MHKRCTLVCFALLSSCKPGERVGGAPRRVSSPTPAFSERENTSIAPTTSLASPASSTLVPRTLPSTAWEWSLCSPTAQPSDGTVLTPGSVTFKAPCERQPRIRDENLGKDEVPEWGREDGTGPCEVTWTAKAGHTYSAFNGVRGLEHATCTYFAEDKANRPSVRILPPWDDFASIAKTPRIRGRGECSEQRAFRGLSGREVSFSYANGTGSALVRCDGGSPLVPWVDVFPSGPTRLRYRVASWPLKSITVDLKLANTWTLVCRNSVCDRTRVAADDANTWEVSWTDLGLNEINRRVEELQSALKNAASP